MKEIKKTYIGRYSGGGGDVPGKYAQVYNWQPGPEIEYNMNCFAFRSKEISTLNSKNINILASGCSNSMGWGIFKNNMWSNYLYEDFKLLKNNINIDNISYPGASIHSIIRNINAFINNYGTPNYIFICFPSIARNLYYYPETDGFVNAFLINKHLMPPVELQKKYSKEYVHENNLLFATTLLYMLESICVSKGIKLIWTSWNEDDCDIFKELNFNNFIDIKTINSVIVTNLKNDPYWEIGKDGVHFGAKWHKQVSTVFFDRIKDEI